VGQALREDAPDIRNELDEGGEEAEGDNSDKKKEKSPAAADKKSDGKKGSPRQKDSPKSSTAAPKKHVIVLPTTRSNKRGEDNSPGALPPQSPSKQPQQPGYEYQQVLPPHGSSSASTTSVPLPAMVPPQARGHQHQAGMYPPSSQSSASSATLRHGQFSLRGMGQGAAMSQKAMEMMNQQQVQMYNNNMMAQNPRFGRGFHPPSEMSFGSHGSSVSGLSGFTNSQLMNETLLSGVSDGVSSLTAGDASHRMSLASAGQRFPVGPMDNYHPAINRMNNNMNNNNMNMAMNPPAVGMFQNQHVNGGGGSAYSGSRGNNMGFNNYSRRSGNGSALAGSDLSGQTMPAAQGIFGRTSSHNDLSSLMREDLSMTEHSLMGGGIRGDGGFRQPQQMQMQMQQHSHQQQQQYMDGMDASVASGHSFASRTKGGVSYKDGMDFSVFSGASLANSVANRSARDRGDPYGPRHSGTDASISHRSRASKYSISEMSQSIASMSLHSGASVASFSA
jgi:hypothetical protein